MIYNEFRPARLSDVIGQEVPVRILKNQIKNRKPSNAYLFCGTRGTGKTTVARAFAKAINCGHGTDGDPCMECEVCKMIDQGCPDIIEVDGASTNSVETMRELIGQARTMPLALTYKVYIIDEAHMLSYAASNALLKTLEEPPEHAIFILCTTERYKIAKTISSRCEKLEFRPLKVSEIMGNIQSILDTKGYEMEEDAVRQIAISGDGSMRDALSELDKCIASGCHSLSDVEQTEGMLSEDKFFALLHAVSTGDIKEVMLHFAELHMEQLSPSFLKEELLKIVADKLCYHVSSSIVPDMNRTERYQKMVTDLPLSFSACLALLDEINKDYVDFRYGLIRAMAESQTVREPQPVIKNEMEPVKSGLPETVDFEEEQEDTLSGEAWPNDQSPSEEECPFDDEPEEEAEDAFAGFTLPFPF